MDADPSGPRGPALKGMSEIFISYKREERDKARALADALEARGWSVWWDPKLRAGEHFDDVIEEAIQHSKCVIVLWSALSSKSRYVKDEASFAHDLGKLVPVTIDDAKPPFRFQGLHTIRLQGWEGSALFPGFAELANNIEEKVGRPGGFKAPDAPARPAPMAAAAPRAVPRKRRERTLDPAPAAEIRRLADTFRLDAPILEGSKLHGGNALSWTEVPGAVGYLLQRSVDADFAGIGVAHVCDGVQLQFLDAIGMFPAFQLSVTRTWAPAFHYRVKAKAGVPQTDSAWSNVVVL